MKTNSNLEGVEVKNTRKKLIFIFIVAVIILILVITNNSSDKNTYNNSEITNGKPDSPEKIKNQYNYMSNNTSNSDFKYDDIKKAELAVYDKYIKDEAKEILNQKIYVQIQKLGDYTDVSSATTKSFIIMATDHKGNQWKIISDSPLIDKENVKIYGLYRGTEVIDEVTVPILECYTYRVDLGYLNKEELKEISKVYLNKLSSIYSKEQFSYSSMEEGVLSVDIIYKNKNNDIEVKITIDLNDKSIHSVTATILPISIKFSDVDDNFWYSVIRSFNENISNNEANNMIIEAKAHAIVQSDADHLILTEGQPMTTGIATLKGTQIEIVLFLRQMEVKNENSY